MIPSELQAASFRAYPREAKELASRKIELLRKMPLAFLPLLLRELIAYDWKFPAERKALDRQFAYLELLPPAQLQEAMREFAQLRLSPELERTNWVDAPGLFSEQLSAHLWATHQIDRFRAAAVDYVEKSGANAAEGELPIARLGIVVIGQGVTASAYPLFRKLRRRGVHYARVKPDGAFEAILNTVAARAAAHPKPFAHWYIDGGLAMNPPAGVVGVSYASLTPVRARLQSTIQKSFESGLGSENLRTALAQMRPEDVGLEGGVLNHFQLSLLTEGSGTQIFSTTFVQWAAREAWRRAQPLTLLARFAPRQREKSMKELLSEAGGKPTLDPEGSLVDADMGAYYTWLNQQRLPGADQARFLVWFEDHNEALLIGPGLPGGTESNAPVEIATLI
ncbi:MAG: hypothetical protein M3Y07_14180 [Acidobacteriota bacterium]|nr:hypothetical protein [Acidobacteriota bacterium]